MILVAEAYVDGEAPAASVLALHDVAADLAKDLRLFSELSLGSWLAFVVAAWKLASPAIPHEDWLGFLLGPGNIVVGVALILAGLRSRAAAIASRDTIGDTTVLSPVPGHHC